MKVRAFGTLVTIPLFQLSIRCFLHIYCVFLNHTISWYLIPISFDLQFTVTIGPYFGPWVACKRQKQQQYNRAFPRHFKRSSRPPLDTQTKCFAFQTDMANKGCFDYSWLRSCVSAIVARLQELFRGCTHLGTQACRFQSLVRLHPEISPFTRL